MFKLLIVVDNIDAYDNIPYYFCKMEGVYIEKENRLLTIRHKMFQITYANKEIFESKNLIMSRYDKIILKTQVADDILHCILRPSVHTARIIDEYNDKMYY